jgi:serine/threonine-protein kinase RsbW
VPPYGIQESRVLKVELSLPRDASFVPLMRHVANYLLHHMHVPQEAVDDIEVVVSEACANVVRHAEGVNDYSVSLSIGERGCEVVVADLGADFALPTGGEAAPEAETGRGLQLMRALVDDLQFLREADQTRVHLRKQWEPLALPTA